MIGVSSFKREIGGVTKYDKSHSGSYTESTIIANIGGLFKEFGFLLNPTEKYILWDVSISIYPKNLTSNFT